MRNNVAQPEPSRRTPLSLLSLESHSDHGDQDSARGQHVNPLASTSSSSKALPTVTVTQANLQSSSSPSDGHGKFRSDSEISSDSESGAIKCGAHSPTKSSTSTTATVATRSSTALGSDCHSEISEVVSESKSDCYCSTDCTTSRFEVSPSRKQSSLISL